MITTKAVFGRMTTSLRLAGRAFPPWMILLLSMLPTVAQIQFNCQVINGAITINGYSGQGGDVVIPDTINGLPVTTIGDNAFYGCPMTSLTIGNLVTNIGPVAFQNCTILTNVVLGTNVATIENGVFKHCLSLGTIAIPSSVTTIGPGAFAQCWSLNQITVAPLNPSFSAVTGVLFDKDQVTLIDYPPGEPGNSYVIPGGVTTVGTQAFYGCSNLLAVTVPNGVIDIGDYAFCGCSGLASIAIPDTATNIGDSAFEGCSRLTALEIPDSVGGIGVAAFNGCVDLTNVSIGNGVIILGAQAFSSDAALKSVTIGDSVAALGPGVFFDCPGLTSVTIPSSVTNIMYGGAGWGAFYECIHLDSVYFEGNAPIPNAAGMFSYPTLYYLPGTKGWTSTYDDLQTVLWDPQVQTAGRGFGVQTNRFGFTITAKSNLVVVVESSTNLASQVWYPMQTNTLTSGSAYFNDPQWTNQPCRFYRLRWPGAPDGRGG